MTGSGDEMHKPYRHGNGVTYCGTPEGHDGCGEVWPCTTVLLNEEESKEDAVRTGHEYVNKSVRPLRPHEGVVCLAEIDLPTSTAGERVGSPAAYVCVKPRPCADHPVAVVDTPHRDWPTAFATCLGEPTCEPPDGEVTPDGRQHKYEGRHNPPCPQAPAWVAGDPCATCGSRDTAETATSGGVCNGCGARDSDDD